MHAVAKILPHRVQMTHVRLFKSVLILENFVKRGYMRLNKRMRATIRDVPLFEVVRYMFSTPLLGHLFIYHLQVA